MEKSKEEALFNTQQNAEEKNNLSFSENREEKEMNTWVRRIEESIFNLRWSRGNGYAICIGMRRITKWFESEEEALKKIEEQDWNMTISVIESIVEAIIDQKEIERRIK